MGSHPPPARSRLAPGAWALTRRAARPGATQGCVPRQFQDFPGYGGAVSRRCLGGRSDHVNPGAVPCVFGI